MRRVEGELRRREAEISQLERRLKSSQANERSATAAQATAEEAAAHLVGEVRGAREEVAGKEAKLLALHKWARLRKPGSGRTSPVESAPDDAADSLLRDLAAAAVEFSLIDESAVALDSEGLAEALTAVLRTFASPPPALLPPSAAKQREANQAAASGVGEMPAGADRSREREEALEAQVEALAEGISDANAQLQVRRGETCPCNCHPSGWLRASALTCRLISLVGVKWSCLRINKQAFPPLQEAAQRFAAKLDEASGAHRGTIAAQAIISPTSND